MRSHIIGIYLLFTLILCCTQTTVWSQSNPDVHQIKDFIWLDVNGNSYREPGEPGIANVEVRLLEASDSSLLQQTLTNETGDYIFDNLKTGAYIIEVDGENLPQYRLWSDASVLIELNEGLLTQRAAFSFQPLLNGSISYRVWHDENGNHLQDPNEPGIPAVAVRLYNDKRKPIGVAVTDNSGYYSFGKLPVGNYYVSIENAPKGYALTTPSGLLKTVGGGDSQLEVYFGLTSVKAGAICNRVIWEVEGEERGIEGVTINLFDKKDNLMGVTVTDSTGYYIFNQLAKNTYRIQVELSSVPQGLTLISPEHVQHTLQIGEVFDKGNFVFRQPVDIQISDQCVDEKGELMVYPNLEEGEWIDMQATTSSAGANLLLESPFLLKYNTNPTAKGADTLRIHICTEEKVSCREEWAIVHRPCSQPIAVNDGLSIIPGKVTINGNDSYKLTGYDGIDIAVLENDQQYCQDKFYLSILDNSEYGYAVVRENNTLHYRPNEGFEGKDKVYYQICNECGDCDQAFLAVVVKQPIMQCDPYVYQQCTNPDKSIVVCPDFCLQEAYTITNWETVFGGTVEVMDQCIKYTAGAMVNGGDVIKVTACTEDDCETSFVNITIGCEGAQPPVTIDDKAVSKGETVSIDVLQNDTDPDGSVLTITSHTSPQNGDVSLTQEGIFLYTPFAEFTGTDVFYYQVCDEDSLCLNAKVSVEVSILDCNEVLQVEASPVSPVDICPDFCKLKGAIAIENVTNKHKGTISIEDACVKYVSPPMFAGTEYLTITGCDESGECETVSVTVEVSQMEAQINQNPSGELLMFNKDIASKEATLELEGVVPNMSFDAIYVNFSVAEEKKVNLEVFDMAGKMVYEEMLYAIKGFNASSIDISQLSAGIYQVQLTMENKIVRSKFVK